MSLLKNIKLTEEQEKDFLAKLDEWKKTESEKIKEEVSKELEKRYGESSAKSRITEDGDIDFTEEETEIMNKRLTEWKEKIQEETEDALGDKFYEVFKNSEESLKKQYSEKFIKTMKEMYTEIEEGVRAKLLESSEFKAFAELKKVVAPFIIEGEYKDTVMEDISKLKKIISEQKDVIDETKQKAEHDKIKSKLDQLTEGMPAKIKEQFIANLGSYKTENELIEAFQANVKLVKQVKEQVINELKGSDVTDDEKKELKEGEEAPAEETPAEEKPAEETPAEETPAEEAPESTEAPSEEKVEESTEAPASSDENIIAESSDIDYEILSEDFKREEKKSDNLNRLRELAGVE